MQPNQKILVLALLTASLVACNNGKESSTQTPVLNTSTAQTATQSKTQDASKCTSCSTAAAVKSTTSGVNLNGIVSKEEFTKIFPLSDGDNLLKQYTLNSQEMSKYQEGEYAKALTGICKEFEDKKDWNGQALCLEKHAPNYFAAWAKLQSLAGQLQNCPAVNAVDSHGTKVDFSGQLPPASSIYKITTLYTYENFVQTTKYFPTFLSNSTNAKRELAALLANVQQETTGLCFASETPFDILIKLNTPADFANIKNAQLCNWLNDDDKKALSAQGITNLPVPCSDYNLSSEVRNKIISYTLNVKKPHGKYCGDDAVCVNSGNYYFGRGAIQLSYPYNYKSFGQSDFVKSKGYDLVAHPDLVDSVTANKETSLLWGSALWFWLTPQTPKPSAHAVMTDQWHPTAVDIKNNRKPGFGTVINIVNGGLECGKDRGADKDLKANNRIDAYQRILSIIGAPKDTLNLDCKDSKDFRYQ